MPKITVLMPSLNVIKYIRSCIESVCNQTLQDMEILVIDAGSEDGSLEVLEEYAAMDNRIRIIHADRKSYGYQLNIGIDQAQGDYIGIVETDDMIVPDMYETLYNAAIKEDVEYVKGRFQKFVSVGEAFYLAEPGEFPPGNAEMSGEIIEPRNMPELLVKDIYLWTGIYKKQFIKKIRLNETSGAAFQDQGFLFQTISSARKAAYLDRIVYEYRQDNNNSSIFNRKGFRYIVNEYSYIEKFLTGKDNRWKRVYYTRMFNQCIGRFEMMALSGEFWDEAVSDMEILRERLKEAVQNGYLQLEDLGTYRWKLLEHFLKDVKKVYSCCADELYEKLKMPCDVLKAVSRQTIVIFGCGRRGQFIHALLENKCSGQVIAYCDNNSEHWESSIQGKIVLSPETAVRQYPEAVYVIANLKSTEEMKQQLQKSGINDAQICLYQGSMSMLLFHMKPELESIRKGDRIC